MPADGTPARPGPTAELAGLHRADWRFLLAPPRAPSGRYARLLLLGAAPGDAATLRELRIADEIVTTPGDTASADVAVLFPGALVSIAALQRALVPNGQLYLELDRRSRGSTVDARQLRRAGWRVDAIYAVPPLDQPRRYVPLGARQALRWYFSTLHRPVTRAQRLAATIVPRLSAAGAGAATLGRMARTVAIVARAPGTAASAEPPLGLALAQATGVVRDADDMIVHGEGGDRVVLLPFARGGAAPAAVLKIPRAAPFAARTIGEQSRLHDVRAHLPEELRRSVPEPLGQWERRGMLVAAETCAPGRSMLASSGSWGASTARRRADLAAAMRWVVRFHESTLVERRPWDAAARAAWVEQPMDAYHRTLGCTAAEAALFDAARAYASHVSGAELPVSRTHGDFAVWNLLRDGATLSVTDWEGAGSGCGYADALHLVTSWDVAVRRPTDGADERRCFARLFLGVGRADSLHREAMDALTHYRTALGIDDRLAPLLLLQHRIELALRRAAQQADAGSAAPDPRAANRPAGVVSLLAEHGATLFGGRVVHSTLPARVSQ